DRNLGNYINSLTGRKMILWDGACHVHEKFSIEKILDLKKRHPQAEILVHPECTAPVRMLADKTGSTAVLLDYTRKSKAKEFIVATESGIIHQMRKECPDKIFIPAPPADSTCSCNECSFMKLNTLEKLRDCLCDMTPAVEVDEEIAVKARRPIEKMLELSPVK
ncbi:MAG: quinolinate synthase NadA, partial [Paramuribaculum sp.]|nr:quinolinate synthase NadA [Paramuribaculum sp.]